MSEPSVKGTMALGSVVLTRRLRDKGQIPAEVLEKSLSEETRELLDERIVITKWYPMWQFNELQELFWERVARRNPDVMRQSGADSFKSMSKTGRYQQFEYAARAESAESKQDVLRHTRMITSVMAGYYNFLEVKVGLDDRSENLQITYDNASMFCEPLRFSTEGFMNGVSRLRNGVTDWTSERVAPDRIVFTLPNARAR